MSVPYALKALDAQTLGGRPASAFLAATGNGGSKPPASVTGSGTKNFIPRWTSTNQIGDSVIFQNTSGQVGINTTTPGAKLDVNGRVDIRDILTLFPNGTAPVLNLSGSAFNIDHTGKVTFISGQNFPGTGTITGVTAQAPITGGGSSGNVKVGLTTSCSSGQVLQWNGSKWVCSSAGTGTITGVKAGTDLTGGGNSGNVTLNLDTTKVPQLAAANTFTASQTVTINSASPSLVLNNTSNGSALEAGSVNGTGIFGSSERDSDFFSGITGVEDGTTTKTAGVFGYTSSGTGMGVYGQNVAGSSVLFLPPYAGVWGDSSDGEGLVGTSDNYLAIQGINNNDSYPTLLIENETNDDVFGTLFLAYDANAGTGGSCTIDVIGDVTCSGVFTGGAPVDGGKRKVGMPSLGATENWFEDAGSGKLSDGSTVVQLDPVFAQTVNANVEYHVFLTPKGDCEGLYVSAETPQGFEVHELRHGHSSIAFDYRIMAKRKGYETARLVDVTQKMRIPDTARGGGRQARPVRVPSPRASGLKNVSAPRLESQVGQARIGK